MVASAKPGGDRRWSWLGDLPSDDAAQSLHSRDVYLALHLSAMPGYSRWYAADVPDHVRCMIEELNEQQRLSVGASILHEANEPDKGNKA